MRCALQQIELAHVTRVATLGELTASIAHEVNQPLGALVNNTGAEKAAPSTLDARRGRTYRDWTICKWVGPAEPLERIPPAAAYATRNTSTESRRPRSVIGGRGSAWIPA